LRVLAKADESLSAQQLADLLDASIRPQLVQLRAFLRAGNKAMVYEVRRGGFVLGRQDYRLRTSSETDE
jgi:hypothetical protein